jgi:hypothetical protein
MKCVGLQYGINVILWEGDKHVKLDATMKSSAENTISFTIQRSIFSFSRPQVSPIYIDEIFECSHGVRDEVVSDILDDPRFLTIVVGSPLINPRTLCFKFKDREERNSVLQGLRAMISDVHLWNGSINANVAIENDYVEDIDSKNRIFTPSTQEQLDLLQHAQAQSETRTAIRRGSTREVTNLFVNPMLATTNPSITSPTCPSSLAVAAAETETEAEAPAAQMMSKSGKSSASLVGRLGLKEGINSRISGKVNFFCMFYI